MKNLILTNTQLSASQDDNWRTGVEWIIVVFIRLSFWRHPFTAEDPLVSKWGNATFLQIFSDEDKHSSTS